MGPERLKVLQGIGVLAPSVSFRLRLKAILKFIQLGHVVCPSLYFIIPDERGTGKGKIYRPYDRVPYGVGDKLDILSIICQFRSVWREFTLFLLFNMFKYDIYHKPDVLVQKINIRKAEDGAVLKVSYRLNDLT